MAFKRKITKTEWLEANGFSEYGVTYLVLGNSYPIKDSLKDAGFKFSPLLRWHGGNCDFELPEGCYYKELQFEDVFVWNEEEKTYDTEYGEEYKIKGKNDVLYTQLPDGEYSYSIILDNALGTKTFTKPRTFQMQDGKITYK
jgi:hypothetical protein